MLNLLMAQCITALALSGDGRFLAAGFSDGFVRIYDPASGACLTSRLCHDGPVTSLDFFLDTLLSVGDARIGVWWADTLGPAQALPQEESVGVFAGFFLEGGKRVITTDAAHPVRLWDFRKRRKKKEERYTGVEVNLVPACAALSPDENLFFIGYQGWTGEVWDTKRWEKAHVFEVWSPVKRYSCCFSPDGRLLAFNEDETVYIYETGTWKPLRALEPGDTATALAFSGDGKVLLVGTSGGTVQAWDTGTWKKLVETETRKGRVNALAVGEFLFAGCQKGLAILPLAFREE